MVTTCSSFNVSLDRLAHQKSASFFPDCYKFDVIVKKIVLMTP